MSTTQITIKSFTRIQAWVINILLISFFTSCGPTGQNSSSTNQENSEPSWKFLISLPSNIWRDHYPDLDGEINIFLVNQDGTELEPMFSGLNGYNFVEDVSPSGKLLISSFSSFEAKGQLYGDLYITEKDGSNPVKLTNGYQQRFGPIASAAMWLPDSDEAVYIATSENVSQIFISSSDGKEIQPLVERAQIQSLHPPLYFEVYTDKPRLYWKNGILDLPTIGIEQSIWYYDFETNITDNITSQDDSFPEIAIAPSGNRVIVSNEAGNWLMDWDFQQIRRLPIEGVPQGMFWSPSGKFLLMQVTPENSGSENGDLYLWEVNTLFANKIGTTSGMPIAFWSPDEQYVALLMFDTTNNLLEIRPILLNVDNLSLVPLFDKLDLGEVPFLYIHWISDEMAS